MATQHRNWTEQEIEKAIDLYVLTSFGRLHSRNPDIIRLAGELDRTPGSVALKLTNLASIDETLDRKGMSNASKLDRVVWGKFFEKLQALGTNAQSDNPMPMPGGFGEIDQAEYAPSPSAGQTQRRLTDIRVGQTYFRKMVMASYGQRCAITGISQTEFLVAGHIRPWASDVDNRMNPRNGICLNRLHDKAFEEKLIAIENDGHLIYSKRLNPETKQKMLKLNDSGFFKFPRRFKPDLDFLAEHRDQFLHREATS